MKKLIKFLKLHIQQFNCKHKHWWIVCIYLFVPTFFIVIFDKLLTPILQNYMSGVKVNGGTISNSEYAMNNVIDPFAESLLIIIGFLISYFILRQFHKKLIKSKVYFAGANKCVKFIETATILLAIIIAVYGKTTSFDYTQYGCSVDTIKESIVQEESASHIALEEIPTIHSTGIRIEHEISLYNILLPISQYMFYLSDNLEIIIAIVGAVIIPLNKYSEEIEKMYAS